MKLLKRETPKLITKQQLIKKIDALPQAILHKSFKGKLVQLPTDGDAKDLLAEIMKLKEGMKKKK